MNIYIVAAARRPEAKAAVQWRATAAIHYAEKLFKRKPGFRRSAGNAVIYNSNSLEKCWDVPTFMESAHATYSFSQPPVPVAHHATNSNYSSSVIDLVDLERRDELLPNYAGTRMGNDGSITGWTDSLGMARAFCVKNEDMVAVSNHIGALSFFLESAPEMNDRSWGLNAVFAWFGGHETTLKGITSLPAGSEIACDAFGEVSMRTYSNHQEIFGARPDGPDFSKAVEELEVVSANINTMATRVPKVYLSGGQDSRMSAGAWLASGAPAKVVTFGTLPREASTAHELMELWRETQPANADSVTHETIIPAPGDTVMPLDDRVMSAFELWDGDTASNMVSRDVPRNAAPRQLAVGGFGGELMHGYFYQREGLLEQVRSMSDPADRLRKAFPGHSAQGEWVEPAHEVIQESAERARQLGHTGPSLLDLFYLQEKYRRWPNSRQNSHGIVPLAAPSFLRLCYDLTPEQRLAKTAQREVADRAVPGWGEIPYYKGTPQEQATHVGKHRMRLWHRNPEELQEVISARRHWPKFFREERIDTFYEMVQDDRALSSHEAWFYRCIIAEKFPAHVEKLRRAIREGLEHLSDTEVRIFWSNRASE